MGNLIKMDLYRMRRSRGFWICLILAFVFALSMTPLEKALTTLASLLSGEKNTFDAQAKLSAIIADPFPMLNAMLAMLSACIFFYMDMENGYIKNIAGQMPEKGYSILSRFLAFIPYNLLFMLAGIGGNLLGTVFLRRITADSAVAGSLVTFLMKFLLLQAMCAILLLVTATFQNKSLGTVLAVLLGTGILSLLYFGIDSALHSLLPKMNFSITGYMPDQLLGQAAPKVFRSVLVSAVTAALFLFWAVRLFDKRDIK